MNNQDTRDQKGGQGLTAVVGVIMVITAVLAVIAIAFSSTALGRSQNAASPSEGSAIDSTPKTVDVVLADLSITPSAITLNKGQPLTLNVKNDGKIPHNLSFPNDKATKMLNAGESESLEVGPITESVQADCSVPGHKEAGMVLDIKVTNAPASSHSGHGSSGSDSADAKYDGNATAHEGFESRDPRLAPVPNGTVHKITFDATEKVIEVAPGVKQEMWTFNNTVPGPTLHGKLGDVFDITLNNKGALGHSIDFHASFAAWDTQMRTIQPGESLRYRFKAEQTGIFMYHCGTAPALHHIGNGMFGAVVIDPPDLAPVDHEYIMVQSDVYLGPQNKPGNLTKMLAGQPDMIVFNGYANQYKFKPIRVEPNERIRVWVLDAGPSENSSFHIVGTIFDTVFKEGAFTLKPSNARGGAQALDLQPAQGGFVEFSLHDKGLYPIVTHKFMNVGKGALGLFQAGDVEMPKGGGH